MWDSSFQFKSIQSRKRIQTVINHKNSKVDVLVMFQVSNFAEQSGFHIPQLHFYCSLCMLSKRRNMFTHSSREFHIKKLQSNEEKWEVVGWNSFTSHFSIDKGACRAKGSTFVILYSVGSVHQINNLS